MLFSWLEVFFFVPHMQVSAQESTVTIIEFLHKNQF